MTDSRSSPGSAAVRQYKEAWLRILVGIVGNDENAIRGMELAELNGLFDPIRSLAESAALPVPDVTAGREISQHIGWLKQYIRGMHEGNWVDMRLRADRQLEQLSEALTVPSTQDRTP